MRAKHMFVICAYQKSEYLEACIQSLKKQTLGSEIIVTTSTPNERIQSLCERYQLPLKIHENSTGIASDWNYGISQCKGAKYVTIAHQDDTYEPEYAEKVIAKLEKSENPIIAFTDYGEIRNGFVVNDTTLLEIKRKMLIPLQLEGLQNSRFVRRRILGFGDAISCPTVTYCMEQLGEKQPIFADNMRCALDWETWEVLSRMEGAFVYVPEILMHHRIHEESATTENIRASVRGEEEYKIYRKFWPKWMADLLISFYRKSEKYNEIPQEDKNLSQKVEKEACVSVVIPVYNGEAYLAKCLQSLRDQTWENLQIIVVDDGSKDGTREILIDFARVEDRLLVVGQEKGGVSTARNRGISAACGKYLLFVDADDQIPHDYVEKMVRTAEKHGAEMVLSGYDLISEQGEKIGSYRPDAREEWKYQISAAWGHLYRLDFWKKYELFFLQEKDARGEDLPISLFVNAVAKNYKVAPGAVYYYTQHPDSAMGSLSNGDWFGFPYGGIEKMHERIREIGIQTSEELYALGLIKLFAHFTFQIYRNAPEKEKKRLLVFFHQLLNEEEWKLCREAMRRIWKYPVFTTTQKGAMEAFWWQAVATRNRVKRSRYADRSVAPQWTTDSGTGDSSVSCPFGHGEIGLGTGDSSVGTGDSSVSSALVATCQTENCPLSHHPQARQRTVPCPTIPSQDRELSPAPPSLAKTENCPLSQDPLSQEQQGHRTVPCPRFAFVILHYNALEETLRAIDSIKALHCQEQLGIVVVDNASTNQSGKILVEQYQDDPQVRVVLRPVNDGFSRGNNAGMVVAREWLNPDYYIVANNDITFPQKDFLKRIWKEAQNSHFGVLGPDIYVKDKNIHQSPIAKNPPTITQVNTTIFMNQMALRHYDKLSGVLQRYLQGQMEQGTKMPYEVYQKQVCLMGACLIFSKRYVEKRVKELSVCPGFYPETNFYYEEFLCRLWCDRKNLRTVYQPKLQVLHGDAKATKASVSNDQERKKVHMERILAAAKVYRESIIQE